MIDTERIRTSIVRRDAAGKSDGLASAREGIYDSPGSNTGQAVRRGGRHFSKGRVVSTHIFSSDARGPTGTPARGDRVTLTDTLRTTDTPSILLQPPSTSSLQNTASGVLRSASPSRTTTDESNVGASETNSATVQSITSTITIKKFASQSSHPLSETFTLTIGGTISAEDKSFSLLATSNTPPQSSLMSSPILQASEHHTPPSVNMTVIEIMVPIVAISLALIFRIKQNKIAAVFRCFLKKKSCGTSDSRNMYNIASAEIGFSSDVGVTSTPDRCPLHEDKLARPDSEAGHTAVPAISSEPQVPLYDLNEKAGFITNLFASRKDDGAVPDQNDNIRTNRTLNGSNTSSGSAFGEHEIVSALRSDVVRPPKESPALRIEMVDEANFGVRSEEQPPLYDLLFERSSRNRDS